MTERSRSGKTAWDKEKTRELFRRYKETGDPDARELRRSDAQRVRNLGP